MHRWGNLLLGEIDEATPFDNGRVPLFLRLGLGRTVHRTVFLCFSSSHTKNGLEIILALEIMIAITKNTTHSSAHTTCTDTHSRIQTRTDTDAHKIFDNHRDSSACDNRMREQLL